MANECVDLTLAEFSPWGELLSISPILDDSHSIALSSSERREVERLIVEGYNRTRQLPEFRRARTLIGNVRKGWVGASDPGPARSRKAAYRQRILNSCCLSFEVRTMDSSVERFEPPDFRVRRIIGASLLNVVCRRRPRGAIDIWIQVHHTGADGLPMQEFLTRLEIAWGLEAGILFPIDQGLSPKMIPCFASQEERPSTSSLILFILIGSMALPCANGQTSGVVSIKGEYTAIRDYPLAIRRAIQAGARLSF